MSKIPWGRLCRAGVGGTFGALATGCALNGLWAYFAVAMLGFLLHLGSMHFYSLTNAEWRQRFQEEVIKWHL